MNVRPVTPDDLPALAAFLAEDAGAPVALGWRQGQHREEHGPVWFVVRDGDELAAVAPHERVDMHADACGIASEKAIP